MLKYRYSVTEACLDMSRLVVAKQKAHRQTDRHKVIELVDDGYKMRFRHIQVRQSTGIRACGNKN